MNACICTLFPLNNGAVLKLPLKAINKNLWALKSLSIQLNSISIISLLSDPSDGARGPNYSINIILTSECQNRDPTGP